MFLPSREQYKNWKLPSKYALWDIIFTILSIIIALVIYFIQQRKPNVHKITIVTANDTTFNLKKAYNSYSDKLKIVSIDIYQDNLINFLMNDILYPVQIFDFPTVDVVINNPTDRNTNISTVKLQVIEATEIMYDACPVCASTLIGGVYSTMLDTLFSNCTKEIRLYENIKANESSRFQIVLAAKRSYYIKARFTFLLDNGDKLSSPVKEFRILARAINDIYFPDDNIGEVKLDSKWLKTYLESNQPVLIHSASRVISQLRLSNYNKTILNTLTSYQPVSDSSRHGNARNVNSLVQGSLLNALLVNKGIDIFPIIQSYINSDDAYTMLYTIAALSNINNHKTDSILKVIIKNETNSSIVYAALLALGKLKNKSSFSFLLNYITEPYFNPDFVKSKRINSFTCYPTSGAIRALGYLGDKRAVTYLLEIVNNLSIDVAVDYSFSSPIDARSYLRASAILSLGMLRDKRAVEPIKNAYINESRSKYCALIYDSHQLNVSPIFACIWALRSIDEKELKSFLNTLSNEEYNVLKERIDFENRTWKAVMLGDWEKEPIKKRLK